MIVQYLEDEEYTTSMMTVQDEANVKISANTKRRKRIRRLQASILGKKIRNSFEIYISVQMSFVFPL